MHRVPLKRSRPTGGGPVAVRSRRGAFTLLELTVVIVIIAALAALIIAPRRVHMWGVTTDVGNIADRRRGRAGDDADHRRGIHRFRSRAGLRGGHEIRAGVWLGEHADSRPAAPRHSAGRIRRPSAAGAGPTSGMRRASGTPTLRGMARFPPVASAAPAKMRPSSSEVFSPTRAPAPTARPATSPQQISGKLIVVQVPPASAFSGSPGDAKRFRYARLVSAGADGVLSTPLDRLGGMLADGTARRRPRALPEPQRRLQR